ncbi:hypothetical protein SeLEV6574_g02448 [Synchytrium endobioticum]|uniref:CCHC-type domain-containing protein n=1 Tax=Synchytrium endobioticum TaxID=286115 RepID=A0A507D8H5_9FUNG|nr:hypothetical protein SeLEV6574_g02448 [Synchytrium endobioticum]
MLVKAELIANELWYLINPTCRESKPVITTTLSNTPVASAGSQLVTVRDVANWENKDAKAQLSFMERVELRHPAIAILKDCTTAAEMWDKLHARYASSDSAGLYQHVVTYSTIRQSDNETVTAFYNRFREPLERIKTILVADAMEATYKHVDTWVLDRKAVYEFVGALNSSFSNWKENFILNLKSSKSSINLQEVYESALTSDISRQDEINASALFSKSSRSYGKQYKARWAKDKSKIRCHRCRNIGHFQSECPENKSHTVDQRPNSRKSQSRGETSNTIHNYLSSSAPPTAHMYNVWIGDARIVADIVDHTCILNKHLFFLDKDRQQNIAVVG